MNDMQKIDGREMPNIRVIGFTTEYEASSDPASAGELVAIDYVTWQRKGDNITGVNIERVDRMRPRTRPARTYTDHLNRPKVMKEKELSGTVEWAIVGPAYAAWKEGQELPVDGTPLIAWPGMNAKLVEVLKKKDIETVEDFASASSSVLSKIPYPDIKKLQSAAENFLLAQGDISRHQVALDERDKRLNEQEAILAKQSEDIARLTALVQDSTETKGKPKSDSPRPAKTQEAAA